MQAPGTTCSPPLTPRLSGLASPRPSEVSGGLTFMMHGESCCLSWHGTVVWVVAGDRFEAVDTGPPPYHICTCFSRIPGLTAPQATRRRRRSTTTSPSAPSTFWWKPLI
jgi:hypothetical protein